MEQVAEHIEEKENTSSVQVGEDNLPCFPRILSTAAAEKRVERRVKVGVVQ